MTSPARVLTQVQKFILARIRDAGRPMVLVGGSGRTYLTRFETLGEPGVVTRSSVIDILVERGYVVRVDAHRCQLTSKGVDAISVQRNKFAGPSLRPRVDGGNV